MAKRITSSYGKPRPQRSWFGRRPTLADQHARVAAELDNQLTLAIERSAYARPAARKTLAHAIVHRVLGARPLPADIRKALFACAEAFIEDALAPFYRVPKPDDGSDPLALIERRQLAAQHLDALADESRVIAQLSQTLERCLAALSDALLIPRTYAGGLEIPVPLGAVLNDLPELVDTLTRTLSALAPDPDVPDIRPGVNVGRSIIRNLLQASKLSIDEAQKRPARLTWPARCNVPPAELAGTYLMGTPFDTFLSATTALRVPPKTWFEHVVVTATTGWGKSQLMQALLLRHFDDPSCPGVLVVDSQGDVFRTLSRLECFDPSLDNRLVIIDPSDAEHSLAFNLLDVDRDTLNRLSGREREEFLAGLLELFTYIFGALLGAELTAKMQVVFRYLAQWIIEIPDATVHTLLALLTDPSPYLHHVEQLPPTAQTFINDHLLIERSQYRETCQQIARRLFHVLSNPTFERIFSHPKNKFSIGQALNDGRIVFVNTAKAHLKAEWSAIFGKFIVAQVMQATFARSLIPQDQRRPAHIHIDEASEYLDQNIDQILIQGRKFKVALYLYVQTMQQAADAGLKASFLSIPAIRFTGGLSDADATLLAKEMNTTPEFLKSVRKHETHAECALYVRGLTPTAVRYDVPFLQAERAPKMSATAYAHMMQRIHAEVAAEPSPPAPRRVAPTPPDNSGDSY